MQVWLAATVCCSLFCFLPCGRRFWFNFSSFPSREDRLAKISPYGESLSFVSAKESNQRKTDPGSARKPAEKWQFEAKTQLAIR
jgi:hypothetical protein